MLWFGLAIMALYVAGNGYVFWRLWQVMSPMPMALRVGFAVVFWTVAMLFFVAMAMRNSEHSPVLTKAMMWLGTTWMVFILYMVLATALFDIVHLFVPALNHGVLYALGITTALLVYGSINYHHPRVEHIDVELDKSIAGDGMRMVMASDIHLGYGTDRRDLERYVEMINREQPDVVVIVGDLIDNSITPVLRERMGEVLDRIDAPNGVYVVPGNHEYISGIEACEAFIRDTKATLLRDSVVTLHSGIQIVGRDDRMNRHRKSLDELVAGVDMSRPVVVLDHQPYDIARSNALGVDIHLSGHTHRGQIWPLSLLTDAMYDQSHGYRRWSHTHAYVSCGLSLWGPPFRIGTHSDLAVIDIRGRE